MKKLEKNLEKEFSSMTRPKPKKRTGGWTLLLVGDHGKIISSGKVVGPAIFIAVLLFLFAGTASYFYFVYKKETIINNDLRSKVSALQSKVNALKDEKDLITVQLVMAESRLKSKNIEKQEKKIITTIKTLPVSKPLSSEPEKISTEPVMKISDIKPVSPVKNEPAVENHIATDKVYEEKLPVQVENLDANYLTDLNTLKVKFIIRKIDVNLNMVSGKAFVLLKSDDSNQEHWILLPKGTLIAGKPTKITQGQYFSIARFKLMKFVKKLPVYPEQIKNIEILIYSTSGKLLLEKTFPFLIKRIKSSEDE